MVKTIGRNTVKIWNAIHDRDVSTEISDYNKALVDKGVDVNESITLHMAIDNDDVKCA